MSKFAWLPKPVRAFLRRLTGDRFRAQAGALRDLSRMHSRRIIVGSAGIPLEGWVATDKDIIDLLREETWRRYFQPESLDAILGEHVWEHLTTEEAAIAARTCYRFLKPAGYLRVAVPDGLHPDPSYIEAVRPGGTGSGADDHKVLYTYGSFRDVFTHAGFDVRLYEYFDEQGQFHYEQWIPSQGMIHRSRRFDTRNAAHDLTYTSIVLDAIKPAHLSAGVPALAT
jgi:predicted SAM-dependent methyltransferase